jgi:hypothetical protein
MGWFSSGKGNHDLPSWRFSIGHAAQAAPVKFRGPHQRTVRVITGAKHLNGYVLLAFADQIGPRDFSRQGCKLMSPQVPQALEARANASIRPSDAASRKPPKSLSGLDR